MSTLRVREAGDSALIVELDSVIDAGVNARMIATAAAVRSAQIQGVRDVVSTYRSVAVYFNPLVADVTVVRHAIERAAAEAAAVLTGRTVEIPVAYGGPCGPDLDTVAGVTGLSAREVVSLHAAQPYRVYMLGFLPGFAYMGSVPEPIAVARHPSPRLRVPRGSVGIAGRQTGVYPTSSPGGWQIIGRTALRVFDPAATPPSMLAPGDSVQFMEAGDWTAEAEPVAPVPVTAGLGQRSVTVLHPGLFTTVQDQGRWGHQASGVAVAGALDRMACATANLRVGNDANAAVLEATIHGPEIRLETSATVAVAGADLGASLDGAPLGVDHARRCRAGSVIRFGGRRMGARAYLAFDGGVAVPRVLDSRATHVTSALGGVSGRALIAGDQLPLGDAVAHSGSALDSGGSSVDDRRHGWGSSGVSMDGGVRVRVLPGPQDDRFPSSAFDTLLGSRFRVSAQSNRMAYRLSGPTLARLDEQEMISDATFVGALQVPPSGQPMLLLADRPTTGGYPQIAIVITADLPRAAQLAPGDWIEFSLCSRGEAVEALKAQEDAVRAPR